MELSQSDKYLIVVGIIFCIALAVLSPYIASGDPDGLEKSAEDAAVGEDVEAPVEYYNLQGVKVANPAKGLYIKSGKKFIVK